jgi:hypothetical protein
MRQVFCGKNGVCSTAFLYKTLDELEAFGLVETYGVASGAGVRRTGGHN